MDRYLLERILHLRLIVGFLGEKDQLGWWPSSFFALGSQSFLLPIFGKTPHVARYAGVSKAAALVHDDRIGLGNIYHLFRLPEHIERELSQLAADPRLGDLTQRMVGDSRGALENLQRMSARIADSPPGPVYIGSAEVMGLQHTWGSVATHYLSGVNNKVLITPYLAGR